MLKYNRKIPCTLEGHSKNLSFILYSFKNMCIDQGHNNVHVSSTKINISYPIEMHSRSYSYRFSPPKLRQFRVKISIFDESDIVYPIPMSEMIKGYSDNK